MCKEPLVQFYSRAGFELIGPSGVVHGQDPWLLMSADDASRWTRRLTRTAIFVATSRYTLFYSGANEP